MTYLRDDLREDEQQVADSGVLTPEQQAPEAQIQPSDEQPAQSGGSITSGDQSTSQGPLRPSQSRSPKQFTDVKKYIQKNQPQAQKMASKAKTGIESKAADIGKQAQARRSALSNVIDQNKKQLETEQTQAMETLNKTISGTPQIGHINDQGMYYAGSGSSGAMNAKIEGTYDPSKMYSQDSQQHWLSKEDYDNLQKSQYSPKPIEMMNPSKFQEIMRGQTQLTALPELNLAQQEIAARRLGQAQMLVPNVLRETFAKPERTYTSGQQRLDELLLGGTGGASQLQQTARGTSEDVLGRLAQMRAGVGADIAAQKLAQQQMGQDITSASEQAASGIVDPIQARLDAEIAARQGLLPEFTELDSSLSERMSQLRGLYGDDPFGGQYDGKRFDKMLVQHLRDSGSLRKFGGDTASYGLTDQDIRNLGIDPEWYQSNVDKMRSYNNADTPYLGFARDLRNQIMESADPAALEKALLAEGLTPEQLVANKGLTLSNLASDEDIARYNALQGLTGETGDATLLPEGRGEYLSEQELRDLLSKYR